MEFSGQVRLPAPRQTVWKALNDPAVLRQCLPGCEELVKLSENEYAATIATKIASLAVTFQARLNLSDIDPPSGYTVAGQGDGGNAGFARGRVHVKLQSSGGETLLDWQGAGEVGGKLANIGGRLIQGVAARTAEDFFSRLRALLQSARAKPGEAMPAPQVVGVEGLAAKPPGSDVVLPPETEEAPVPSPHANRILAIGLVVWLALLAVMFHR